MSSNNAQQQIDDTARQAQNKGQELQRDANQAADKAGRKAEEFGSEAKKTAKDLEKKASRAASDAKKEAAHAWDVFSSNPEYWASTLASVNLVLLGGLGVWAYLNRDELKRTDRKVLVGGAVGIAGLVGAQTYAASEAAKKQNNTF